MERMRFTSWRLEGRSLVLHGAGHGARLSLLPNGVWRIHAWCRPEGSTKGSLSVEAQPLASFQIESFHTESFHTESFHTESLHSTEDASGLRLHAPGALDLLLALDPFTWRWDATFAEALEIYGENTPWAAQNADGPAIPFGPRLTLTLKEPETPPIYLGLGERTGGLNKRGRVWRNWATDDSRHFADSDPLYQAHPFVMGFNTGKAYGLFLDETWRTAFDLAFTKDGYVYIHTDGPTFDLYLLPGPTPGHVVQHFATLIGRAQLPPLWALGYHQCRWSYPDETTVREIAGTFRARQLPLDALWLDIDYMDRYKVFTFADERFPNPKALTADLAANGIKTVAIVDPGVKKEAGYAVYEEGHAASAFITNADSEELSGEVWPNPAVWPDFSREDVRDWWAGLHRFYLEHGIAGIWNDMNEPAAFNFPGKTLPPDARQGDHSHAELHNAYGYQMCQATHAGLTRLAPSRRPFLLTRSGYSGIQKYAWVWTGDNVSTWDQLEMSVPMLLNLGLSGVAFCGADIGGFSFDCDGELLARWTWLGAFYPFMRNHSGKGSRHQEPWAFGEHYAEYVAAALRYRYRLMPYLYTLAWQASRDGLPLMRPMLMAFPNDAHTHGLADQFLLGADLLVAPILRSGMSKRAVYLPEDGWCDVWSGKRFTAGWHLVDVPLGSVGLWQRPGSAVPLVPNSARCTADLIHENAFKDLLWQVTPAAAIAGEVYEDAGDDVCVSGPRRTLTGHYDRQGLKLRQPEGGEVRVEVLGLNAPRTASLPWHLDNGRLSFTLAGEARFKW